MLQWNLGSLKQTLANCITGFDSDAHDILLLQETFHTKPVSLPGYIVFEQLATMPTGRGRPTGGIISAVRSQISALMIDVSPLHIHLKIPDLDLSLVNCYYPPETDVVQIIDDINGTLDISGTGNRIIVCGDFNCRIDIPFTDNRGDSLAIGLSSRGLTLCSDWTVKTFFNDMGGSSAIDLIFSNCPQRLRMITVGVESDSTKPRDHRQVRSIWRLKSNNCGFHPLRKKRLVDVAKLATQSEAIHEGVERLLEKNLLNEALNLINGHILSATSNAGKQNPKFKRWFDRECYEYRQHALSLKRLRQASADAAAVYTP